MRKAALPEWATHSGFAHPAPRRGSTITAQGKRGTSAALGHGLEMNPLPFSRFAAPAGRRGNSALWPPGRSEGPLRLVPAQTTAATRAISCQAVAQVSSHLGDRPRAAGTEQVGEAGLQQAAARCQVQRSKPASQIIGLPEALAQPRA